MCVCTYVHIVCAAQELCYLCKERAQKNVSAEHLSEERRREEKEEERLVMVNQLQLEQELLHRDQVS